MRLFLNAVFHLKMGFPEICPKVIEILEKYNWENPRTLFHFQDVNDAKSESQTSHAKLCKAFPQFAPYWKSDYEEYGKTHLAPIEPHQISFLTNFPGWQQGEMVFLPEDKQMDTQTVMKVCEKVPRPYSFYMAAVVLDGIDWYEKSGMPAYDWRYMDMDFPAGTIRDVGWMVELYQSNCVILAKEFDMKPDLWLRMELTDEHGKEDADKIVEEFAHYFGKPDKKYIYPIPTWEEKEQYVKRIQKIRELYGEWKEEIKKDFVPFEDVTKTNIMEKIKNGFYGKRGIPSRKTLQKKFLENNGFRRHDICRWDDHGWCRQLPHNIWLYISTGSSKDAMVMGFHCYGIAFDLHNNVISNFIAEEFQDKYGDVSGVLAFEKFTYFLNRFIDEVVPQIVELYPDDDRDFYQESIEHRYFRECYRVNVQNLHS